MREATLIIAAFDGIPERDDFARWAEHYEPNLRYEFAEGTWLGEVEPVAVINAQDYGLCQKFFEEQDAILHLGPQLAPLDGGPRKATLLFANGSEEGVGYFTPVFEAREPHFDNTKDWTRTKRTNALGQEIVQYYQILPERV